ncbi:spn-F [Drosophila busckii]|uniref:Spn-F n=1 Tax=Drosophila busckii TaxID=30019 RepID=A0A0M4EKY2_DROBS|nr:protein spindle-F [Drosophila busckii]ALC47958.1 spn-F [Drosophila busckii]
MEPQTAIIRSTSSCSSSASSSDKMNYALQVALQTMKERCIQLQQRVSSMEEENQRLRDESHIKQVPIVGSNNVLLLQSQVDELQRQKEQLLEQISMVSDENRRLWSSLSKISKDQPHATEDVYTINSTASPLIATNQNLIRSKTFTQHSPNPHLRQKVITDVSFEEIVLADFETNKAKIGYPCELNVYDASNVSETDNNFDAKHCMEGLQDLRREAMKQQQELNSAITKIGARIVLQPCPDCAQKTANKPEMADKSLETEESLSNEPKKYHSVSNINIEHEILNDRLSTETVLPDHRLSIIQDKMNADSIDKTCPMCGKLYSSQVSFKAFQEHVEMHFIDEPLEAEASIDRQFEFISHAVGDF